jgi:Ca2+-binding EF-hand superfamily protein
MKFKRKRASTAWAFAIALGIAAGIGVAVAQQVNEDAIRKAFADADVNGDGVLNVDEYVGHVVYVFKRIDVNRDGFITFEEAIAFSPAHNVAAMKAMDRNGDGKLSLGEVAGAKVIDFFEMDTNRDGVITVQELIAYERRIAARPAAK